MQAVRVEKVRPVELLIRSSIETLMVAIVSFWKYDTKNIKISPKNSFEARKLLTFSSKTFMVAIVSQRLRQSTLLLHENLTTKFLNVRVRAERTWHRALRGRDMRLGTIPILKNTSYVKFAQKCNFNNYFQSI
jgi:hypothetical protein